MEHKREAGGERRPGEGALPGRGSVQVGSAWAGGQELLMEGERCPGLLPAPLGEGTGGARRQLASRGAGGPSTSQQPASPSRQRGSGRASAWLQGVNTSSPTLTSTTRPALPVGTVAPPFICTDHRGWGTGGRWPLRKCSCEAQLGSRVWGLVWLSPLEDAYIQTCPLTSWEA